MSGTSRPLGITIISILSGLGGLSYLFFGVAALGFGGLATAGGASASVAAPTMAVGVVYLVLGLVTLFCAYGLWALKSWAWMVAVVVQLIGLATVVLAAVTGSGLNIVSAAISILIVGYLMSGGVKSAFGRA